MVRGAVAVMACVTGGGVSFGVSVLLAKPDGTVEDESAPVFARKHINSSHEDVRRRPMSTYTRMVNSAC